MVKLGGTKMLKSVQTAAREEKQIAFKGITMETNWDLCIRNNDGQKSLNSIFKIRRENGQPGIPYRVEL